MITDEEPRDRLGWKPGSLSWRDVASAAGNGQFHFAMTSPTASNAGFSALVGVADARITQLSDVFKEIRGYQ